MSNTQTPPLQQASFLGGNEVVLILLVIASIWVLVKLVQAILSDGTASVLKEQASKTETSSSSKEFRHRGFLFMTNDEYCPLCDDNKTVYGLWFRDATSIRNQGRLKIVAAHLSNKGYKISNDDYYNTILQGQGGVEELNADSGGGSVLWFVSAKKILSDNKGELAKSPPI